jgi:hypothetical protein
MLQTLGRAQAIAAGSIRETEPQTASIGIVRIKDDFSPNAGKLVRIIQKRRVSELEKALRSSLDGLGQDADHVTGSIDDLLDGEPQIAILIHDPKQVEDLREQMVQQKIANLVEIPLELCTTLRVKPLPTAWMDVPFVILNTSGTRRKRFTVALIQGQSFGFRQSHREPPTSTRLQICTGSRSAQGRTGKSGSGGDQDLRPTTTKEKS